MKNQKLTYLSFYLGLSLIALLSGQACETQKFSAVKATSGASTLDVKETVTAEDRQRAFRRAKLIFEKKAPSAEELLAVSEAGAYEAEIYKMIEGDDFLSVMKEHHEKYFGLKGTEDDINLNEPANLASHIIEQDKDFREIITADYCVNDQGEMGACSGFADQAQQKKYAAGAVTTRGFLTKWNGPFNFRRVKHMFENFTCKQYPDDDDEGMTEQEISESVKGFACTDCVPACYSCHRSMNARAALFYDFDQNGFYNPSPNSDPERGEITLRDDMSASTVADLLNSGVIPRYHGEQVRTVREYAEKLANSKAFENCTVQRFTNFAMGKKATDPIPTDFEPLRNEMSLSGFRIKDFYKKLLTSEAYLTQ